MMAEPDDAQHGAEPPLTADCWRCGRKLFELVLEADRVIPSGTVLRRKCDRCNALNRVPLDKLAASAL